MPGKTVTGLLKGTKDVFLVGFNRWFQQDEGGNDKKDADAFVLDWQKFELENMEKKKLAAEDAAVKTPVENKDEKRDLPEKKTSEGTSKEAEARRQREDIRKDVMREFGQKSTIHGVNKVLEKSSFLGRRLFWLFLVLTGCGLFLYQVTERVLYYYQWPVAVNVKVNYNKTLRYPAVTICNQNTFRLSAAANHGLYEMLDKMYSVPDLADFDYQPYAAVDLTMDELFNMTAHTKENMIVDCWWGNDKCQVNDFQTSFTDHGLCFTFNGLTSTSAARYISQTGADNGLRLRLNVEQYEYMRGPHDAAGLKLLIHDRHEIPFVRDLGEAIPTGSHSFIGIEILEVKNLPSPHGNCSENNELTYYDFYSVTACRSDCITRAVVAECGCRDTYMPELRPGYPKVCSLLVYLSCMVPLMKHYHQIEDECDCPVPCDVIHFRPTLSYATTSSLNTDQLLQSNTTELLSQQFVQAKETAQRVISSVAEKDSQLFTTLKKTKDKVEAILPVFTSMMDVLDGYKDELLKTLQPRTWWHKKWGLDQIKYTTDHDFKRGWDFMDERTFMHVTTGFYQMSALYRKMVEISLSNLNETTTREAWYISTERDLYLREQLAVRALDNYTHFYWSYKNATPVYEFIGTPNYHYDAYVIAPEIIRHDEKRLDFYFKRFTSYMMDYIVHVGKLRDISRQVLDTANYSQSELEDSIWHFEKRSRNFNYYRYFTNKRLVEKACQLADDVIELFLERNKTLYEAANEITITISNTFDLIESFKEQSWTDISKTVELAHAYTHDERISKKDVATMLTSKAMEEHMRVAETYFKDMHTRAQQLADDWQKFRLAYSALWANMLGESTLKTFYPKLEEDINLLFSSVNETAYILETVDTLVEMLDISEQDFRNLTQEELARATNADFVQMTIEAKEEEIKELFDRSEANLIGVMGNRGDVFLTVMEKSRDQMNNYLESIQTNAAFVRENFLQVNVFMRELSYEEIEQGAAYDVIALLSDVGGSMGLFVGASVISLFEIGEMLIQSGLRKRREKQMNRQSSDC